MSTTFYLKINNFEILGNFGLLVVTLVFVFEDLPTVFLAAQNCKIYQKNQVHGFNFY